VLASEFSLGLEFVQGLLVRAFSFLNLPFNAAPLIKLKKAPRQVAQRILGELEVRKRAVNFIVKAAAERTGVNPAASVHRLRHAHASHAIDNGAPITLVSATLEGVTPRTARAGKY
jgi:integrase